MPGSQCESDANRITVRSKVELTYCDTGGNKFLRFDRTRSWFASAPFSRSEIR